MQGKEHAAALRDEAHRRVGCRRSSAVPRSRDPEEQTEAMPGWRSARARLLLDLLVSDREQVARALTCQPAVPALRPGRRAGPAPAGTATGRSSPAVITRAGASSLRNVPLRPPSGRVAAPRNTAAPCSALRVPRWPLRSVAAKPGQPALTRTPVPAASSVLDGDGVGEGLARRARRRDRSNRLGLRRLVGERADRAGALTIRGEAARRSIRASRW